MRPLQLGQLLAAPLQSAVRAQNLALQETIAFIEQFGLEEGVAKTFRLRTERAVEKREVDPETGAAETKFTAEPLEISIPLLALVSPPSLHLQEMNAEFGVEIVEPREEPKRSAVTPQAVLGSSLASSLALFTPLGQSNPTTMKVNMKIVREIPEGTARLGDLLTDLLSAHAPPPDEGPPRRSARRRTPPVERIRGIGPETADLLRARNIRTVRDFLDATVTRARAEELAAVLGVTPRRITGWRRRGVTLIGEE